jgi:hypothetical protein
MSSAFMSKRTASRVFRLATLALFLLSAGSGCGVTGSGTSPTLIPVKGKVTFKGEPLSAGTVRFEPDDFGRPATGQLKSDGTFVLTTTKEGDCVVAGHHIVSIEGDPRSKAGAALKKYFATAKSKLEAEVSADKTEINFDIP